MARDVLIYLSFHEPWRLRLPVEPIPPKADIDTIRSCIFDLETTDYYFQHWLRDVCAPYTLLLKRFVENGANFLVGVSGPLLQMVALDHSAIAGDFLSLLKHPNITPVCADASNSISIYLGVNLFRQEMEKGRSLLSDLLGRTPHLAVAPLTSISNEIYHVCWQLGFVGMIVDGSWDLLKGRNPGSLYRNGLGPVMLPRNSGLSLKTAAMLTEPNQTSYSVDSFPLADRIVEYPTDFLLLGWQVGLPSGKASYGNDWAILERLFYEIVERGIRLPNVDNILSRGNNLYPALQLPSIPALSSDFGNMFYFLGHPTQQEVFCLMRQAFSIAKLTRCEPLVEMAIRMAQWDILGLLHHLTVSNGNGSLPHYFAPVVWSRLGVDDVVPHLRQLYEHFIQKVTDAYL